MTYITLSSMLSDNCNIIEIYLTKTIQDKDIIDIKSSDKIIKNIYDKYKNLKTVKSIKYIAYHRNEQVYLYDLTDDNQIVFSKHMDKSNILETKHTDINLFLISYKYSKIPIHFFPCLNDIDYVSEYTISEHKISNRISLIVKEDKHGKYVYIEYKHSPNVDIDKIEQSINNIVSNLLTV